MTEQEYNECVMNYADNIYRFALKNLRNEEDAKDITQTSFEKLWVNREKVDNERCKSYLFTIAYHQIIDHVRKNRRVVLQEDFSTLQLQSAPGQSTNVKKILNEAIYRLNDLQRSLILLKDYEGYSYNEIAEITSLNLSQVKVYLHRARIQLKNYLVKPENVI